MALEFDLSCVITDYLNACIKASSTPALSDPGGQTPAPFQFIIDDLEYGQYLGRPLLPSLWKLLLERDYERAAAARRAREPAPTGDGGRVDGGSGAVTAGGGENDVAPARRQRSLEEEPVANPCPVQCLRLLPGDNTRRICWNAALPLVGGTTFCKRWHVVRNCFSECPWRGSQVNPSAAIIDEVAAAMATACALLPETSGMGAGGST